MTEKDKSTPEAISDDELESAAGGFPGEMHNPEAFPGEMHNPESFPGEMHQPKVDLSGMQKPKLDQSKLKPTASTKPKFRL
ncbi:MAG: hypothetical protein AAF674_00715 [Pseudomonadota bacterium]